MKTGTTKPRKATRNKSTHKTAPSKPTSQNGTTFTLRRILVPVDFSEVSGEALVYALALASLFRARITLVHVVELATYPMEPFPSLDPNTKGRHDVEQHLRAFGKEHVPEDLLGKTVVRRGNPDHEIVTTARREKSDLIIMATRGHTALRRALLGSTAERVVRHAPCPVLTVGQG